MHRMGSVYRLTSFLVVLFFFFCSLSSSLPRNHHDNNNNYNNHNEDNGNNQPRLVRELLLQENRWGVMKTMIHIWNRVSSIFNPIKRQLATPLQVSPSLSPSLPSSRFLISRLVISLYLRANQLKAS